MAARPMLEPEFFLLGWSDDTRALLDHVRAEAPALLPRVAVVESDTRLARVLRATGARWIPGDPSNLIGLLEAGIESARVIAIFPAVVPADADRTVVLVRALRRLCPHAELFAKAATREDAARLYAVGAADVLVPHGPPARARTSVIGRFREGFAVDTP